MSRRSIRKRRHVRFDVALIESDGRAWDTFRAEMDRLDALLYAWAAPLPPPENRTSLSATEVYLRHLDMRRP